MTRPLQVLVIIAAAAVLHGCSSEWYLMDKVEIKENDIAVVREAVHIEDARTHYANTKPVGADLELLRTVQLHLSYRNGDLYKAIVGSLAAGIGLGFYESKNYYAPRAFPTLEGTQFHSWFNMNTAGDQTFKMFQPDKIFRAIWQSSSRYAWNRWLRYFGHNWVYATLADYVLMNGVAGFIRRYAKNGEWINFEVTFDWRFLEVLR